jgi:hypothetical protein
MKSEAWMLRLVLCVAALAGATPTFAQSPPAAPAVTAGVRVQLFVDQRRIAAAKKHIGHDGLMPVYGHRLRAGPQALELRPDSDELLRRWKGDFVLGHPTEATFETDLQFLPVLLVLDISNESGAPLQVVNSALEVQASVTDRQPFIAASIWEEGLAQGYFDLRNHGWGRAENARLDFAFGRDRPATETFALALGTLGAVEITPTRALTAVVPPLPRLIDQPPRCPSNAQVPACLARLRSTLAMGRIADIAYTRNDMVLTRLMGTLRYQWRDADGRMQPREHPVDIELQLFRFDTGEQAEMGAGGPEEAGFKPITLLLDRTQYRLPLPYRPRLAPGQNQRFQLTLNAPKASRHLFRVVLELSDGSRVATPPVDLLYFVPQYEDAEARQIR